MTELLQEYWILLVAALVIGLLLAWWIFVASRRTTIEREDMGEGAGAAKRNQALIDAPPAATPPAAAPVPTAEATPAATPASATGDDLSRIKGVGPKLVTLLGEHGVTSFAQIAVWDDAEIDRIDAHLGRFQGRIRRDSWVEQAQMLAGGDLAAYQAKFGRTA